MKIPRSVRQFGTVGFSREQCLFPYPVAVTLRGYGNPDFQQYADVSDRAVVKCASVACAIDEVRAYITQNDLGGGNWGTQSGIVFDPESGHPLGHISYNGRFWPADEEALLLCDGVAAS